MISDKRERNCIRHTMSERLAESVKKPPLRLLVMKNGMPIKNPSFFYGKAGLFFIFSFALFCFKVSLRFRAEQVAKIPR